MTYIIKDAAGKYVNPSAEVEIGAGVGFDTADEAAAEHVVNHREYAEAYGPAVHAEILEGRANDAAEEIRAGEHDGLLDVLMFAEKEVHGHRKTVVEAIIERRDEIVRERQADDEEAELDAPSPADLASL